MAEESRKTVEAEAELRSCQDTIRDLKSEIAQAEECRGMEQLRKGEMERELEEARSALQTAQRTLAQQVS